MFNFYEKICRMFTHQGPSYLTASIHHFIGLYFCLLAKEGKRVYETNIKKIQFILEIVTFVQQRLKRLHSCNFFYIYETSWLVSLLHPDNLHGSEPLAVQPLEPSDLPAVTNIHKLQTPAPLHYLLHRYHLHVCSRQVQMFHPPEWQWRRGRRARAPAQQHAL